MCGFCTETAVFRDLLGEMKEETAGPRDLLLYPIYLQEASDWRAELRSWKRIDHPQGAFVALCRHWSERLATAKAPPLEDDLSTQALNSLQEWLATLNTPIEWQWTICSDGCPPDPLPLNLARETLDEYIEGWIKSSRDVATIWDQKTLHERFLSVSIAFDIVSQCAPDDLRLTALATHSLGLTPFFDGLELWLQRRALGICAARSGVSFIKSHFDELRIESVLSVAMRGQLAKSELAELQAFLRGQVRSSLSLGPDDLVEALEEWLEA